MLYRALERTERLCPLAVGTAIPEQPRTARRARDRHRPTGSRPDAVRERCPVLKVLAGDVARGARDLAVATQPRVEKELAAERRRAWVVGVAIGRVAAERREAAERQRAQEGDL